MCNVENRFLTFSGLNKCKMRPIKATPSPLRSKTVSLNICDLRILIFVLSIYPLVNIDLSTVFLGIYHSSVFTCLLALMQRD